ncbi:glutathione S-transferase [Pseudolabrys sp. Root1462]|jgi:glutathione S-transferase|uniref:glutathione S-transferase family protein n=1 Tax=Pseudolabrys sp. Root1462 TaxID=1736466 RepID=UPI000702A119|nr:glutathione S-transferase N-terminal domain-containing protein [Pseudolabrys sp. Root1462]KQY98032.1 glutathione S-transferase [Pseudolabrys sp. Root1462]
MLTFYYATDTCALASHIALKDAGADYRLHRIDFATTQQRSAAYLALNPKGRVPALVTPEGILTETPAILAYVAQAYPQARLAPTDPFRFAKVQEFNSYLCSTLHVAHAHRMRGSRWADEPEAIEAMKRKVPQSVGACYDYVETQIAGPWVMGEAYSIADAYLFTVAQWLEGDGVDPARYPKVIDHRARMAARPNVAAAIAEEFALKA